MIRLIEQDQKMLSTLTSSEHFRREYDADVAAHREVARNVTAEMLSLIDRLAARSPWTGYLAVDDDTGRVIGCCGFKGNPDERGCVEIAYFTFPEFEGHGYGTEMARSLCATAAADEAVKIVCAHTLPQSNASTNILGKVGFRFAGEIVDPEDGLVWRWERSPA